MLGGCDVNSKIIQFVTNNSVILEEERMMSMERRSDNNQTKLKIKDAVELSRILNKQVVKRFGDLIDHMCLTFH